MQTKRKTSIIIVSAVLLLLLVIAGLIYYNGSGDEEAAVEETNTLEIVTTESSETADIPSMTGDDSQTVSSDGAPGDLSPSDEKEEDSEAIFEPAIADPADTSDIGSTETTTESEKEEPSEGLASLEPQDEYVDYTFRNNYKRDDHYEKHGIDMGFKSAEEYEDAASDVVNNPESLHKTEKDDGDDVYYLEDTNEIVIVSTDGYIRTYFSPDDGIKYYNRQ